MTYRVFCKVNKSERVLREQWRRCGWVREHPATAGLLAVGLLLRSRASDTFAFVGTVGSLKRTEKCCEQAELLEHANNQYSLIVQRVEQAHYPVNKMVPPTPNTVPLSIPVTFLHDVGQELHQDSKTGIQVRQYSDYPFPWRTNGGPHDDFERQALLRLRQTNGTSPSMTSPNRR